MTVLKIAAAAFIAASLVGCGRDNPDAQKIAKQTEQHVERAVAALDDATITAKVKTTLIADNSLSGLSIDVDTSQNVVTLRGMVASDELRRHAEELARKVEGVKEVKNELTVKAA